MKSASLSSRLHKPGNFFHIAYRCSWGMEFRLKMKQGNWKSEGTIALSKSGSSNTQHVLLPHSLKAKPSPGISASVDMVRKQRSRWPLASKSFSGLFRAAEYLPIRGTGWDTPGVTEVVGWNDIVTHLRKFMLLRGGSCWLEKKAHTLHPSLRQARRWKKWRITSFLL